MTISEQIKRMRQGGFTLIELIVVVAIIGVLIGVIAPSMTGSTDSAKAKQFKRVAANIFNNWQLVNSICGTSTQVTAGTHSLATSAGSAGIANMLFGGLANVAPAKQTCYQQSKILPIEGVSQNGAAWTTLSSPVVLSGGGSNAFVAEFDSMSETVALNIVQDYNSSATINTIQAATGGTLAAGVTYGPVTIYGWASETVNVAFSRHLN